MLNLTYGTPTGNNSAPTVAPDGGEDTVAVKKAWEEIERLASLPIVQYELARTKAAERLGMRAVVLDGLVKSARPKT